MTLNTHSLGKLKNRNHITNAAIKALHDMKKSLMIIVQFFVFLFLLSLHISVLFVFAYFIFEAHKADKWHRVIPIHDVVLFKTQILWEL